MAGACKTRLNAIIIQKFGGEFILQSKIFNVPNTLSLVRVFLAPLVLLFLSLRIETPMPFLPDVSWGEAIAAIVFIIASITDFFDGYIARRDKLVTTLGKFIDPLADKVLVISAMLALIELNRVPAWIVMVIITREFVVTGLRLVAAAEGVVIAASKGGKLKTVCQIIALIMLILNIPYGMLIMWVAMILTVWSGMDYLIKGSKIITG
ncbi:MAG: CDP-diacylglycerol--glycerol-3-phosphate 3-phosphatidyltransferase [Synergistaceae bacterium]|nr:CDP-diacylglycerol--glycerol-3-phosphate 3-phosphatidyltransferase [Synergistaceae bacterium]MBQ9594541.1 CDP-diacylglycerol--glycerol-3-phosphate 3-phosphatidyltransferase [Synergistaceae bacterium]